FRNGVIRVPPYGPQLYSSLNPFRNAHAQRPPHQRLRSNAEGFTDLSKSRKVGMSDKSIYSQNCRCQSSGNAVIRRQLESTDRRFAPCSLIPGDSVTPTTYFCFW